MYGHLVESVLGWLGQESVDTGPDVGDLVIFGGCEMWQLCSGHDCSRMRVKERWCCRQVEHVTLRLDLAEAVVHSWDRVHSTLR